MSGKRLPQPKLQHNQQLSVPLDPKLIDAIEADVRKIAVSVDSLLDSLSTKMTEVFSSQYL